MSRLQGASDSRALRILPWWWAVIGTATAIVLGTVCWLVVWSIAGHSAALQIEAIKVGLSVSAGVGAAGALLLAFRRQLHNEYVARDTAFDAVQRRVTELYTKAVEQLGHDNAAVRLGGLYALERLAQDNSEQRQTVVDVVCAYLRMPFDSPSQEVEELQVRLAAQRLLHRHLQDPKIWRIPVPYWEGIKVDLNGARLAGNDVLFNHSRFHEADFSNAEFDGEAWFNDTVFEGMAYFDGAWFKSRAVFSATFNAEGNFDNVHFDGLADFSLADFADTATFSNAQFEGEANFEETKFKGSVFTTAKFQASANFHRAKFTWARFAETKFNDSEPNFTEATVDRPNKNNVWPPPWQEKLSDDDTSKAVLVRRRTRKPKPPARAIPQ